MIHITGKYKCKDTNGDEHIVLTVVCWDSGQNVHIRKHMIEIPGGYIKDKNGLSNGYYPTSYMTAGELDIELDLESKIEI